MLDLLGIFHPPNSNIFEMLRKCPKSALGGAWAAAVARLALPAYKYPYS